MAKKALIEKANRKPKFAVRGYTRCQRCGRPHSVFRKFGLCRICLREMAHAGELPGVQVQLVSLTTAGALAPAAPQLHRSPTGPRPPSYGKRAEPRRERHHTP